MPNARKILGLIARPFLFLLYGISGLFRRDPKIWVFGSWSGQRFADNSAALFEYTASLPQSDITPIWITHDPSIVDQLRAGGHEAYLAWSLAGLRAVSRSGVLIYDGLTKDINHWLSRGANKVLLRHGIGIKKIERTIDNPNHRLYKLFKGNPLQQFFWWLLIPWHSVKPTLCIATSADHAIQGKDNFGISDDRIVITGFPRNDRLVSRRNEKIASDLEATIRQGRDAGKPVWLYMPTFRDDASGTQLPLAEMESIAEDLDLLLLIKLHFVDGERNKYRRAGHSDNFHYVDPRVDAQSLYTLVDGLISDYSSAPFDFILTGSPVILFTPDMDEFQQHSRSFYYDFDEIRPGPRTRNIAELKTALQTAIAKGNAAWKLEYDRALDRFHQYRDAESCQRTYSVIHQRFAQKEKL
ncbi:MAG: hypothetical protein GWP58_15170 [Gammaproteobacteria bacterium]|jgi:CDP-glycerol glycerophosphotransferase|nr:hypothetical protein [Gammaproteobacteria bacterium]